MAYFLIRVGTDDNDRKQKWMDRVIVAFGHPSGQLN